MNAEPTTPNPPDAPRPAHACGTRNCSTTRSTCSSNKASSAPASRRSARRPAWPSARSMPAMATRRACSRRRCNARSRNGSCRSNACARRRRDDLEASLLAIGEILLANIMSPAGLQAAAADQCRNPAARPKSAPTMSSRAPSRPSPYLADLFRRRLGDAMRRSKPRERPRASSISSPARRSTPPGA